MPPLIAVLDACVLVPYLMRDTLLCAAEARLYRPAWSLAILAELDRTLRDEPFRLTGEQRQRLLDNMRRAFPRAVVHEFEHLEAPLTNNPKDRHVLAAAIKIGAATIVTDNVRHFLPSAPRDHGIAVQTPDAFLASFARAEPGRVQRFLAVQAATMQRPPTDVPGLLAQLEQRAPAFVGELRRGMRSP